MICRITVAVLCAFLKSCTRCKCKLVQNTKVLAINFNVLQILTELKKKYLMHHGNALAILRTATVLPYQKMLLKSVCCTYQLDEYQYVSYCEIKTR